jgi:signal transduction histidine kinase
MPSPARAPEPTGEETAYVRQALGEVRQANGRAVGWLRVGARALMLPVYGAALLSGARAGPIDPATAMLLNSSHLLLGLALLWWLHRRPGEQVILVGAASDFLSVGLGAWVAVIRPGPHAPLVAALFLAVLQLLLLWSVLTLRRPLVAPLAVATVLFEAALLWRAGVNPPEAVAILVVLAVFAYTVSVAGTRIITLAVRASLEARAGEVSRQSAKELRAARDALEAARAQAETTSALIIHDLRNPLAAVLANVEVARAEVAAPSPAFTEAVEVALAEIHRLAGMAGDLLLVARMEDGLEPDRREVEVEPLLTALARSHRPVVEKAGATLTVRAEAAGRSALDESMVRRLLENLLVNAARHVGPGDRIELCAEASGHGLRLAVRNSGPPVPAAARPHLFEKGSSHGRREWHHAGLGLHLCALVAARHGGTMALVDRPGWGVSFEAELPRKGVEVA